LHDLADAAVEAGELHAAALFRLLGSLPNTSRARFRAAVEARKAERAAEAL